MMRSVLFGTLSVIALAGTAALAQPNDGGQGKACRVQHPAKTHPCTSIGGNPKEGVWFVILKEGAFKTCGPGEPNDTCTEKDKATHTIEIFRRAGCVGPSRKIPVSESRCD